MKKIICVLTTLIFLFVLAGCDTGGTVGPSYSLSYNNSTEEMYVGEMINVKPTITGGELTLKYELSNDIATIDNEGNLTANEKGTVTVTVTAIEDKNVKAINQDKTIGIIICKKDNHFVMEYCSDERIYRTTYELVNI